MWVPKGDYENVEQDNFDCSCNRFPMLLGFVGNSNAFEIEVMESYLGSYVEYAGGCEQNIWHLVYVRTNEPYRIIDWYIDDMYQESNVVDDVKTEAYFWPYWLTGSGTGTTYTIKARAWSVVNAGENQEHDIASYTITVYQLYTDYIGPTVDFDHYCFTGDTHVGQVNANQPYTTVRWYVKGPDETGLGTLVDTQYGDGTSTVSYFSHTFESGSTSGEEYEIYASVWAAHAQYTTASYTVRVWTPPEEVITIPDQLTITDDIKLGDYYTFIAEASSASSNYVIDEIEVLVNGVSVQSQNFSDDASPSMNISGFLPTTAGSEMVVEIRVRGGLIKPFLMPIIKWLVKETLRGHLVGSISGFCQCKNDCNLLDCSPCHPYTCMVESQEERRTRRNKTQVKWSAGNQSNVAWARDGSYAFWNQVPYGHDVTMWLQGDDLHNHEGQLQICKYEEDTNVGRVGEVVLEVLPKDARWIVHNFLESPVATYDPCDHPYPVTFKNQW